MRIDPQDWRYPTLNRGFNPRWSSSPDYIRLVGDRHQARKALEIAVNEPNADDDRSRITLRSGGHCYEDFVCSPDVRVIIDTGLMNSIYFDPEMDAVCVESGASNWDVNQKLVKKLGLLLPGGSCPTVGAGGHITGGGFGLFSRQHGLTVDYLHAVEVAVANGDRTVELVTATAEDTGDLGELWWAHTGGGGGNFGLVTRFWFRGLPRAPRGVLHADAGWKWSHTTRADFHRIVDNFGRFFADHRGTGGRYSDLFGILLLTPSHSDHIGLAAQIDADVPDAMSRMREFLAAVDEGVGPDLDHRSQASGEHPVLTGSKEPLHLDIGKIVAEPQLNDEAGKYKSAYMRTVLPERHIEAAWQHLTSAPAEIGHAVVQIDAYGAAINAPSRDTAAAQRDSIMKLQHQVYWPAGADPEPRLRWIRRLYQDMYSADDYGYPGVPVPDDVTDGCYVNYPDTDLDDPEWNRSDLAASALYYKDHYERLQRVKRRWDPNDVFRHKQSIRP